MIGSLNIRGLNESERQLALRHFINKNNITSILYLIQTRVKDKLFARVKFACFKDWSAFHNYVYACNGRLWLCWDPLRWKIQYMKGSNQFIHASVCSLDLEIQFAFTGVYAANLRVSRAQLWSDLCDTSSTITNSWLVAGDFNSFLNVDEKKGYHGISIDPCSELVNCLLTYGLEYENVLLDLMTQRIANI